MRNIKLLTMIFATALFLSAGWGMGVPPATAGLQAVSPDLFVNGAVTTEFPNWYQDTNNLKLDLCVFTAGSLCLDPAPDVVDATLGVAPEGFYWIGTSTIPFPDGSLSLLVLGLEQAFFNPAPAAGEGITFGRLRIRIDAPVAGQYTITHPFGTVIYDVTTPGIRAINSEVGEPIIGGVNSNLVGDVGALVLPADFTLALGSGVGPYLFWDTGLPLTDANAPAGPPFYIGDGLTEHKVLGSPFGTNFFRIEGPPGANLGGPPGQENIVQSDTFVIQGRVFIDPAVGNRPPTANPDTGGVLLDNPATFDVLANDAALTPDDVPINPGSIAITGTVGGTAAQEIVNGKPMVKFTPTAGFTGPASFDYTVASFTGATSAPATATLEVEDLRVNRAFLRTKFMKWRIQGSSSDIVANDITARQSTTSLSATLSGGQEVPVVQTNASGSATVTINDALTAINFNLTYQGLVGITGAHIHIGAAGETGPNILNMAIGDFASPLAGTLTAADLNPAPALGINTFEDAVNAILAGNTYIEIHSISDPSGELRGQLGPARLVGTATVGANEVWTINGKEPLRPDETGTITVESSNKVQLSQVIVDLR